MVYNSKRQNNSLERNGSMREGKSCECVHVAELHSDYSKAIYEGRNYFHYVSPFSILERSSLGFIKDIKW